MFPVFFLKWIVLSGIMDSPDDDFYLVYKVLNFSLLYRFQMSNLQIDMAGANGDQSLLPIRNWW